MQNHKPSVLVIEDDATLVSILTKYIQSLGYKVEFSYNATEGLKKALSNKHQLFIVDLGLGDLHGLKLIEKVRAISNKPIIVITGETEGLSEIKCFQLKVNIFHGKPIKYELLKEQIRSLLPPNRKDSIITTREVYLDSNRRILKSQGRTVPLTQTEFDFILMLLKSNRQIFTREQIISRVMNYYRVTTENCVDTMVCRIRKKLKEKNIQNSIIETVNGRGYRLNNTYYKDLKGSGLKQTVS
jgi:DNA-binding response OmpR family regulator